MTWQYVVAGLAVGMLVGVTGMGGGSLLTPLLVVGFGFNPVIAVGSDLLHGAVFKSVGAIRQRRLGTVQARLSGWMFLGSAPMSLLGVWLATYLRQNYGGADSVQSTVLGIALAAGGLGMLAKAVVRFREAPDVPFILTNSDRVVGVLIGVVGGFIVGLTSVGSGVFFGLTLMLAFPLRSAKVVGTDIFHGAALLWVAGVGHLIAGNVDLHLVALLLVGSIPGVLLTSGLTLSLPDRALRLLLSTILLASGIKLLGTPHADVTAVGVLVAGVVVTVGAVTLSRRHRPDRQCIRRPGGREHA